MWGEFVPGEEGEVLRASTVLQRCADKGMTEAADAVRTMCAMFPRCEVHGELKDPIIGHVGSRLAVICPWCSSPAVLKAYEAEGRRGIA